MIKKTDGKKTLMNMSQANVFEKYFEESDYDTARDKFQNILQFRFKHVSLMKPKQSLSMFGKPYTLPIKTWTT